MSTPPALSFFFISRSHAPRSSPARAQNEFFLAAKQTKLYTPDGLKPEDATYDAEWDKVLDEKWKQMDTDGDGCVDKLEFLQKMLVRLGKCETVDIDEIIRQFERFDEDGSVRKTAKRPFILLHFVAQLFVLNHK